MPRKSKPKADIIRRPKLGPTMNGSTSEVLTLPEAAAYLRLSEADVLRLVDEQSLPARQVGQERRFLKSAIQQWLGTAMPTKPSKEAQLAVAGLWKDDPLVEEELRETHRRRGRSVTAEEP